MQCPPLPMVKPAVQAHLQAQIWTAWPQPWCHGILLQETKQVRRFMTPSFHTRCRAVLQAMLTLRILLWLFPSQEQSGIQRKAASRSCTVPIH